MREKKEFEKLLASLKKGDKVLTSSGIYGEVTAIKDDTRITLKVADNVRIDFVKSAVSKVLNREKS
jgi:preprotein translocase subunit YajC